MGVYYFKKKSLKDPYILKYKKWAGMASQQVAVLAAKADVLTSILGSHVIQQKERSDPCKLYLTSAHLSCKHTEQVDHCNHKIQDKNQD